jgi:hypothetical protein
MLDAGSPRGGNVARIRGKNLNEVIAVFVQKKTTIEGGLFDPELVPEELIQVRMGKVVQDKSSTGPTRRRCPSTA